MWPDNSPWSPLALQAWADTVVLTSANEQLSYQELAAFIRAQSLSPAPRLLLPARADRDFLVQLLAAWNQDKQVLPYHSSWPGRSYQLQEVGMKEGALLILTSGSSSNPKAVVHTHYALLTSAQASNAFYDLDSSDSWALSLPLYHIGGIMLVLRCLLAGATIKLPQEHTVEAILETQASFYSFVPTQLARILESEDLTAKARTAKAILVGGAATPAKLYEQAKQAGLKISVTYGMTELASQVLAQRIDRSYPSARHGEILEHVQVKELADGHLQFQSDSLAAGIIEDNVYRPFAQVFSGPDLGKISNGLVEIQGRSDDVFISGGENISISKLEASLMESGLFQEVKIVAVADEEFGQVAQLYYCAPHAYNNPELKQLLREHLAPYEIPKKFFYISSAERKQHGLKLQSRLLRKQ